MHLTLKLDVDQVWLRAVTLPVGVILSVTQCFHPVALFGTGHLHCKTYACCKTNLARWRNSHGRSVRLPQSGSFIMPTTKELSAYRPDSKMSDLPMIWPKVEHLRWCRWLVQPQAWLGQPQYFLCNEHTLESPDR